jgi:hypothetical protein
LTRVLFAKAKRIITGMSTKLSKKTSWFGSISGFTGFFTAKTYNIAEKR